MSLPLGSVGQYVNNLFCASGAPARRKKIIILLIVWVVVVFALLPRSTLHRVSVPWRARPPQQLYSQQDEPLIPRKIWQIFLTPPGADENTFTLDPEKIKDVVSWLARNRDYQYRLVGDRGAKDMLIKHYGKDHTVWELFRDLPNTGLKSDLLRYLILGIEGGVYADTDTEAIQSIDDWIPLEFRNRTRAVVGIEFDRLDGANWAQIHPDLQMSIWTIACAPGLPLLDRMMERLVASIQKYAKDHNSTVANLEVSQGDVIELTGPAAFTDVVFEQIQLYDPSFVSLRNFSGLREPKLVGDILILPIDAFGMGQPHSNSTNDGTVPANALVKHKFNGSWRSQ